MVAYQVRYQVRTVDRAGWDAWRDDAAQGAVKDAFRLALRERMGETSETVLCWQGDPPNSFLWMCPGCGGTYGGDLGDQPVSGWDAPRWVNSGTLEQPTLAPSLGCPRWREGECRGHWWLRDGVLEQVPLMDFPRAKGPVAGDADWRW